MPGYKITSESYEIAIRSVVYMTFDNIEAAAREIVARHKETGKEMKAALRKKWDGSMKVESRNSHVINFVVLDMYRTTVRIERWKSYKFTMLVDGRVIDESVEYCCEDMLDAMMDVKHHLINHNMVVMWDKVSDMEAHGKVMTDLVSRGVEVVVRALE